MYLISIYVDVIYLHHAFHNQFQLGTVLQFDDARDRGYGAARGVIETVMSHRPEPWYHQISVV